MANLKRPASFQLAVPEQAGMPPRRDRQPPSQTLRRAKGCLHYSDSARESALFLARQRSRNAVSLDTTMKGKLKMKNQNITLTSIILALGCFAFLPQMQALSPPPDGCYPGFTTAEGCNALQNLTSGAGNTGVGWRSLFSNTTGSFNTGAGAGALILNNADDNTAVGAAALLLNTTGINNTAVGTAALVNNDTGIFNNAVGAFALQTNVDGSFNNAFGSNALEVNVIGSNNTAVGDLALQNSTGDYNTALGAGSGTDPDIVSNNVYIGDPGFPGDENVLSIGGIAASGTPYANTYIGPALSMPVGRR